ncbi:MAG: deoxynucleoside kinase [Saprospiraceae bacterium]|nr:deoxynucleoside kinase [Saprospiraceae bacterium]
MSPPFPYQYISIEGNIGTGKTSLCQMLAREYNCQLVLEEFADNPFLPYFYQDPARYAFTVELFFMTERHKQLQHSVLKPSLFSEFIVSDYCFWKTIIFARKNLNDEEYRLFQRLFHILNNSFPNPDIIVYLHRSSDKLLQQIRDRGRHYEQGITQAYLQGIQDSYFEFFKSQTTYPIVILEAEHLDFVNQRGHYDELKHILKRKFLPGIHRISLRM